MDSLSSFRKLVSTKSYGIEIEAFTYAHIARHRYQGFFYIATDGSVTGPWGTTEFEAVSQPMPKQWLKREIVKFGKWLPWDVNSTCGIHVHVNSKWCSLKKGKAIAEFLQTLWEQEPAIYMEAFGRGPNGYCEATVSTTSRYHAVNLTRKTTVEFRMFASGGPAWACYCVDMVDWLVSNAYHLTVDNFTAAMDLNRSVKHE